MTDKEIFEEISKNCICAKCKHKKVFSYEPIRDDNYNLIGYKNVKVACHKRTPILKFGIDGKYGIHSLDIPEDSCYFFTENDSDSNLFDMVKELKSYSGNFKKQSEITNVYLKKDSELYDTLLSEQTIEQILDF